MKREVQALSILEEENLKVVKSKDSMELVTPCLQEKEYESNLTT